MPVVAVVVVRVRFVRIEVEFVRVVRVVRRSRPIVAVVLHIVHIRPVAVTRSRQETQSSSRYLHHKGNIFSLRDYLMEHLNRHPRGAVFRHTNTRILFSNLLIFKFTDFQTVPPCAGY